MCTLRETDAAHGHGARPPTGAVQRAENRKVPRFLDMGQIRRYTFSILGFYLVFGIVSPRFAVGRPYILEGLGGDPGNAAVGTAWPSAFPADGDHGAAVAPILWLTSEHKI